MLNRRSRQDSSEDLSLLNTWGRSAIWLLAEPPAGSPSPRGFIWRCDLDRERDPNSRRKAILPLHHIDTLCAAYALLDCIQHLI